MNLDCIDFIELESGGHDYRIELCLRTDNTLVTFGYRRIGCYWRAKSDQVTAMQGKYLIEKHDKQEAA